MCVIQQIHGHISKLLFVLYESNLTLFYSEYEKNNAKKAAAFKIICNFIDVTESSTDV